MNCWVYFVLYFLSNWQLKTCSKVCKLISGRREVVTCLSLLMSYTKHTLPIWHSNYAAESPIFPCQCCLCPAFLLYVLTPTPPQCHAPIFICNIFGERLDWNYFAALKKNSNLDLVTEINRAKQRKTATVTNFWLLFLNCFQLLSLEKNISILCYPIKPGKQIVTNWL